MLSEELLEDLAAVHLHPQTQAGGDLDLTPLLRAVEAAAAAAERERWTTAIAAAKGNYSGSAEAANALNDVAFLALGA